MLAEKTKLFDLFIILITIFSSQSLGCFHKFDANLIFVWLFSGSTRTDVIRQLNEAQTVSNMLEKEDIKPSISLQRPYCLIHAGRPSGGVNILINFFWG